MAHQLRPKLGQHFLASESHRRRIVEALRLHPDELLIEIGAGGGAMTGLIAERARCVVAIEVDPSLVGKLQEKLADDGRIEIIQADILHTDLAALCRSHQAEQCFVFGNLPYYITSPIIHHLLSQAESIRGIALLVQREVADRIVAQPGSRDYGYLSVLAQIYSRPRIVFSVPPGAFSPPPKVHSSLVDFEMTPSFLDWTREQRTQFLKFVKRCFAQKRKNLLNNLERTYSRAAMEEALSALGLSSKVRGEQLTPEQLAALFQRLS